MKVLIIVVIIFCAVFPCKAQIKWDGNRNNLVRIEVEKCAYSIRLLPEGLLCRSYDKMGKEKSEIFYLWDLDYKSLTDLQDFLLNSSLISKDTIIDYHNIALSSMCRIEYLLMINSKTIRIIWEDGECNETEKCLSLINNLIPKKNRVFYEIKPLLQP